MCPSKTVQTSKKLCKPPTSGKINETDEEVFEKARKENSKLKELIIEYGIKDMNDVHEFVEMLTAETIQTSLDWELDNELGLARRSAEKIVAKTGFDMG